MNYLRLSCIKCMSTMGTVANKCALSGIQLIIECSTIFNKKKGKKNKHKTI